MLSDFRSVIGAVGAAGGQDVHFAKTKDEVELVSDALEILMKPQADPDDFPGAEADIATETFSATLSHELVRSLHRVASAISTEETRYYLNGIFIHQHDEHTFRAVATDGHRMNVIEFPLPDAKGSLSGKDRKGIIIPRKTLRILLELIGNKSNPKDDGIGLRVGSKVLRNTVDSTAPEHPDATRAEFHFGDGRAHIGISTKLIDGTFPDYTRAIPNDSQCSILFKAADLRRAVAAVSLGSKHVRAVRLHFEPGRCIISASYLETGIGSSVSVDCQHDWRNHDDLGINGGYLLAMIDAAGGDEIIIRTTDPTTPMVVRNPADTAWTGILMPMRVS